METRSVARGARRIPLLVLYLLVMALSLEVVSRAILASEALSRTAALRSDAGWRVWWLARHREEVPIFYGFDEFHPTRGWTNRPGVRDADTFGPGSVSTNQAGLRGRREVSLAPEEGLPRVAVVGDSFTFGDEVRDREAYPAVLGDLLPEAEVLNFGVHGYGHDQILLLERDEVLAYRPDVVVLGFVRDDMERNLLAFRDFAKPRFVLNGNTLSLRNVPVPSPEEVSRRYRWHPRALDLLTIIRDNYLWRVGLSKRRMRELTTSLLDEMVEEAVAAKSIFVFVYLPHSEELAYPELETDGHEFFDTYCETRAAFCLDLLPTFREAMDSGVEIKIPGHWHASGHRLVAESVRDYIHQRELLTL